MPLESDSGSIGTFIYAATSEYLFGGGTQTQSDLFTGDPGLGWTGPTSDGGSLSGSGVGFWMPRLNQTGVATDPPFITFPLAGALECWMVAGSSSIGIACGWKKNFKPATQQWAFVGNIGALWNYEMFDAGALPTTSSVPNRTWHHLVLSWDATTTQTFFDGSSLGSVSFANAGPVPVTFGFGACPVDFLLGGHTSGFIAEVAIYGARLSAGQVANHFAAAENPSSPPTYIGDARILAQLPQVPTGFTSGTLHSGLTGTSEIVLGSTFAVRVDLTTIPDYAGRTVETTPFYFDVGWVTPITAQGSLDPVRVVAGEQLIYLPQLTTAISYSFNPGFVVSITELAATH